MYGKAHKVASLSFSLLFSSFLLISIFLLFFFFSRLLEQFKPSMERRDGGMLFLPLLLSLLLLFFIFSLLIIVQFFPSRFDCSVPVYINNHPTLLEEFVQVFFSFSFSLSPSPLLINSFNLAKEICECCNS